MSSKRKRENEFVEQLGRTLLEDEACQSKDLTEPKLRDLFLGAVAQLPDSALRRGLEKRSAVHSRSVFKSIQAQAAKVVAASPPAKKSRSNRSRPAGIDFLQESSIAAWLEDPESDACSTKELYKLAAASGGHPGVVSKLCNSCSDPVAAACHAGFLSGSPEATPELLQALLAQIEKLQEACPVVPTKDYRSRPEWPVYTRCFELLSTLLAGTTAPQEATVLVCASFVAWCAQVSPERAVPHAVLMCGFHLATHSGAMLQLLLEEKVPCECGALEQLVKGVALPAVVDLSTYERLLKLTARLRARKAGFGVRTHLNGVVGQVELPGGLAEFLEHKGVSREALMGMPEEDMDQLFELYTEQGEENDEAAGGFFIDTGIQAATEELGGEPEEEVDLEDLEEQLEVVAPPRRSKRSAK